MKCILIKIIIKMRDKLFIVILFINAMISYAQHPYWNTNTQLTPWRLPIVSSKSDIHYEDLNHDNIPDIIHSFILDSIPILWIDDDNDMKIGDIEGDTDNDCLLIDLNKDVIFAGPEDLCIDWVDVNEDGIADIQFVIRNGKKEVRYGPDYSSDYLCVIDIEKDDIKSFIDWNHLILDCWKHSGHSNFYQDYHGNTLLLKMHNSSFRATDPRLSCENPFIFYDYDKDGLTECAVRLMDIPHIRPNPALNKKDSRFDNIPSEQDIMHSGRISWTSLSWDIDNDNGQGNEFDLDMTLQFEGEGFDYSDQVHKFKHLKGLQEANKYMYDSRWRQIDELIYVDEKNAFDYIFKKGKWEYCWFTFDEDDDCNRWERVESYYPYDIFKIGAAKGGLDSHKQADAIGDRGEFDEDNSGKGQLYISPLDGKIHLLGAEWGVWRIDQNASFFQGYGGLYQPREKEKRLYKDPSKWATIKYRDTDNNGFFDTIDYDLNGDTIFEETISLKQLGISDKASIIYCPLDTQYNDIKKLFNNTTKELQRRANNMLKVAQKHGLNTSWYAFWKQPHTAFERYAYAYWLSFYIYRDLKHFLMLEGKDTAFLDKAYYSGNYNNILN